MESHNGSGKLSMAHTLESDSGSSKHFSGSVKHFQGHLDHDRDSLEPEINRTTSAPISDPETSNNSVTFPIFWGKSDYQTFSSSSCSTSSTEEDYFQIYENDLSHSTTDINNRPPKLDEDVDLFARGSEKDRISNASPRFGGFFVGSPLSAMQSPPTQLMDRSDGASSDRIPSSVFERSKSATPLEWSVASNESLFSIHVGNNSFSRDVFLFGKPGDLEKSGELISPNNNPGELNSPYSPGDLIYPISESGELIFPKTKSGKSISSDKKSGELILPNNKLAESISLNKKSGKLISPNNKSVELIFPNNNTGELISPNNKPGESISPNQKSGESIYGNNKSKELVDPSNKTGVLVLPNKSADNVTSNSKQPPVPSLEPERKSSVLKEELGVTEVVAERKSAVSREDPVVTEAAAQTMKDVLRVAGKDHNKEKKSHAEEIHNSCSVSPRSDTSGASVRSFAFPVQKRPRKFLWCCNSCQPCCYFTLSSCCFFICCQNCCHCAWPSCSCSNCCCWCSHCKWPSSCFCSSCSWKCNLCLWPSCFSSNCCQGCSHCAWLSCFSSNCSRTSSHCTWPSCKCFNCCRPRSPVLLNGDRPKGESVKGGFLSRLTGDRPKDGSKAGAVSRLTGDRPKDESVKAAFLTAGRERENQLSQEQTPRRADKSRWWWCCSCCCFFPRCSCNFRSCCCRCC